MPDTLAGPGGPAALLEGLRLELIEPVGLDGNGVHLLFGEGQDKRIIVASVLSRAAASSQKS